MKYSLIRYRPPLATAKEFQSSKVDKITHEMQNMGAALHNKVNLTLSLSTSPSAIACWHRLHGCGCCWPKDFPWNSNSSLSTNDIVLISSVSIKKIYRLNFIFKAYTRWQRIFMNIILFTVRGPASMSFRSLCRLSLLTSSDAVNDVLIVLWQHTAVGSRLVISTSGLYHSKGTDTQVQQYIERTSQPGDWITLLPSATLPVGTK